MGKRPRLKAPTESVLEEIKDEHEYGSIDSAIRHALREAGYDI